MKMEPNHIDDIFRQRLHHAEVPPPAFVWPNVERELQKRKRKGFFLWLFAFGMASAGLWAMLTWSDGRQPDIAATQQVPETPAQEIEPQAIQESSEQSQNPHQRPVSGATFPESGKNSGLSASKGGWGAIPAAPKLKTGQIPQRDINYAPACADNIIVEEIPYPSSPAIPQPGTAIDLLTGSKFSDEAPLVFQRENQLPRAKTFIRKKKDPKYCYNFAENPNVWLLDAYAGPSLNKRSLEATGPASEPYAQMRRATEQTDWSYHAGLRGSLLLRRHFLLRTGLHYEQMTEVFEFVDPSYTKYIVEIINQPGEPTIIDTVDIIYGENYVKTFNRYGMLDVPVEVGAELRSGRFGLSLNAGLSFNVLFWKRGTMLSPGSQPTPFTPGEKGATEVFRTRTGLSASGSAQLFVHLHPTVRVFAEPYYRHVLKPITLDNQPVERRHSNWGVKIGMTKILD